MLPSGENSVENSAPAALSSQEGMQYPPAEVACQTLVSREQIQCRITQLARMIEADYAHMQQPLVLVGVLKGAAMVMADLARALRRDVHMEWMAISSYGAGTKTSGVVRIVKDLDSDLTGRHVLIVEDIIDSGLTLSWLRENLLSRGPASVRICTALRKPQAAKVDVTVDYVGFEIPNDFVVGYGLDFNGLYRNLPYVGVLKGIS